MLEVADDGRGGAAFDGSGLVGLRDRVEALRGRLLVTSPPGVGTTLRAEFPTYSSPLSFQPVRAYISGLDQCTIVRPSSSRVPR